MRVAHIIDKSSIGKKIEENVSFMLTNKAGSFARFSSHPTTRYEGFFVYDNDEMFKILEWIKLNDCEEIDELQNRFVSVERKRKGLIEGFFVPKGKNSLVYELSKEQEMELVFDVRRIFDLEEWGREYSVSINKNKAVIEFVKKKEGAEEYKVYVVVMSDNPPEQIDKWVEHYYPNDGKRNDPPTRWHVYYGLKVRGSKVVIAASKNKNKALRHARETFSKPWGLLSKEAKEFEKKNVMKASSELKFAKVCASYSLNNLVVDNKGIFAGLPWFCQLWTRDEAISLIAPILQGRYSLAKDIILESSKNVGFDGKYNAIRTGKYRSDAPNSADGLGWVYRRLYDLINVLESKGEIKRYMSKRDLNKLKDRLEHYLFLLIKFQSREELALNDPLETWMDTVTGGDDRRGVRIEIQALRLLMYKLMYELTNDIQYKNYEISMKKAVLKKFWNGKILADGKGDFTVRPNIFLAAYLYPELLHKTEWIICFNKVLAKLWLNWGGLSTIDKRSHLFLANHTGYKVNSYHRGDSWFWVNNIAAIAMNRIAKREFKDYINKIMKASAEELLWKGCVGCSTELSSASGLRSEGCCNQAWSNATFLELLEEMGK